MKTTFAPRSLAGLGGEEGSEIIRSWVRDYLRMSGLQCTVEEMILAARRVEGTCAGVTKTKVRKARRSMVAAALAARAA